MATRRSNSATFRSDRHCFVLKYSRPFWVHNWNHNNKYASSPQSRAPEEDRRQSYVTGHSLDMKRHAHLVPDSITETSQLVSLLQETAAPYFPPTLLNYFDPQGHTEKDSLNQESPKTNRQYNTLNATSRQDTPSTLNKWSPLSEEKPSNSKFTFGLSASIFSSLLCPQQVTYEKHKTSQTSRHSSKYVKRNDSVTSLRSPTLPSYMQHDPDTSIRSSASSHNNSIHSDTSSRSSTSSCSDEESIFSPTVRYNVDSATLFGDVNSTSPTPAPRDSQKKKVVRLPPTPSSAGSRQQSILTPSSFGARKKLPLTSEKRKEKQRAGFQAEQYSRNRDKEQHAATPRRAKPECAYLSDFSSPYRDHSSRTPTQSVSPNVEFICSPESSSSPTSVYSLDDMSELLSPVSPSGEQSRSVFSEEPPSTKVQVLTDEEFHTFINEKEMAAVMFYVGSQTSPDTLKVWDREAREKTQLGDRVYGSVDCGIEQQLCAWEYIPSVPFYRLYVKGYPVYSAKHFRLWH